MTSRPTHGMAGSPLYKSWENMRQRVRDVDRYPTYADVVCDDRWATFAGFLANQPTGREFSPGLCLSRHGDVGDYTPENTRWLTRAENRAEQATPPPKSHCVHGHEYTEENTQHGNDGRIRCRTYARERNRTYRSAQRDRGAGTSPG